MTDDTPQYAGVVVYNMNDVPLGNIYVYYSLLLISCHSKFECLREALLYSQPCCS